MSNNQPRKCEKFKSLLGHVTFNYNLFVVFKYFLNVRACLECFFNHLERALTDEFDFYLYNESVKV